MSGTQPTSLPAPSGSGAAYAALLRQRGVLDLYTSLTNDEFDAALVKVLEGAITHLEKNKKNFEKLDEVGLSAALAASINFPDVLDAVQEGHSNGNVDVTIVAVGCTPRRQRLLEAKIYDGPDYHIRGLQQLFTRYVTGRDAVAFLMVYFRTRNIAALVEKTRQRMDKDRPLLQDGPTTDHPLKWSFCTRHLHSSGDTIGVSHIGCNLYIDPIAPNPKSKTKQTASP